MLQRKLKKKQKRQNSKIDKNQFILFKIGFHSSPANAGLKIKITTWPRGLVWI